MRFYLGAQQGLLEKVGKAIFSEIKEEDAHWNGAWAGGFALHLGSAAELESRYARPEKLKDGFFDAQKNDWRSLLFARAGSGENGRLSAELQRYALIAAYGMGEFNKGLMDRGLWAEGQHDLIKPLSLGSVVTMVIGVVTAVATGGLASAGVLGAVAATAISTGVQIGTKALSYLGSTLIGGADPYLENKKLERGLMQSLSTGMMGVATAGLSPLGEVGDRLGKGLQSMGGNAVNAAITGEELDGKGLLLGAAFAGLGGEIASGLGQIDGLGSLTEPLRDRILSMTQNLSML